MTSPTERARELDAFLGDPADPSSRMSYRAGVELDELDQYPEETCKLLDDWGLHHFYVPSDVGGKLSSLEELMWLVRAVARRNLTVAVCHSKTFLGVVNVWVVGTDTQKRHAADAILHGAQAALAYHEQAHGSDLLATTTSATRDGDGFLLSGEKWLVNNATRGRIMTVLARTEPSGGPQGFSLFLVDKHEAGGSYSHLPRLRTTGIRGADFSGIRFEACHLGEGSLLGPIGSALDTSLRSFQITRALLPALSLGAADAGLRAVLEFAIERQLYGRSVTTLPQVRGTFADALASILLCETLAVTALRTLHVAPQCARMITAAAKYFIPTEVDAVLRDLAGVLGARYYLREGHLDGMFQKLLRDHAVVRIFHGGAFQLLQTVGLFMLTAGRQRSELPASVFRWNDRVPMLQLERLVASGGGMIDLVEELGVVIDAMEQAPSTTYPELVAMLRELGQIAAADQASIRQGMRSGAAFTQSVEFRAMCERACAIVAAASAALTWWHGRAALEPELAAGDWLVLALHNTLVRIGDRRHAAPNSLRERVVELLLRLHRDRRAFSLV